MRSFMWSIVLMAALGFAALAPKTASANWYRGAYYYPTYYGGYYNTAPSYYYGSPYYVTSSYYTAPVVTSYYASPRYVTATSYYQPTYVTTYAPMYGYSTMYGGYYVGPTYYRFR